MIYALGCSVPEGLPGIDAGMVSCTVGVPSLVSIDSTLSSLSAAELSQLMSAALVVVVMAWGFKMLGRMLFKGA